MRWKSDNISGWGRALFAEMSLSRASSASRLAAAFADKPGPAIGALRSYGDAALNDGGVGHMAQRLDRFISFDRDNGILEAQAGVSMAQILDITLPKGWAPAALPGAGAVTLGGAIAMDVHGKDHRHAGSFCDQVIELTLMKPDGKTAVVGPKRNAKLFAATLGGLGQTGIILSAKLQLHAAKPHLRLLKTKFETLAEGMAALEASTNRFSVAWIDASARGNTLGRGVLEEGDYVDGETDTKPTKTKSVPFEPPAFAMSPLPTKIFNQIKFGRSAEKSEDVVPFQTAQYPLDQINGWNKLYGKAGFHQFQACFPLDLSEAALRALLEKVGAAKAASPLVVMKRLGPTRPSAFGFAQEGFTLAMDFQNRSGTEDLLQELGDMTLQYGGRIYLAKDSTATSAQVAQMYPDRAAWLAAVSDIDPEGLLKTDMIRRLGLRS